MRVPYIAFTFLFFLSSCGCRSSHNVNELPLTKQKQKITLLQKKLGLAEKEQKKLQVQIELLADEMREAQIAYIRKQIDRLEDQIQKNPKGQINWGGGDLFLEEREQLHQMIQSGVSTFEAQVVLDRILQLITELSDARE